VLARWGQDSLGDELIPRPDDDELLSVKETARTLRVSVKTLYNWKQRKVGPRWVKVGSRTLYQRRHLREYLHEHGDGPARAG
jgi:predicted DNA-binding transcriptional regulator AlpA